ncbi:MAG TPA: hypothetical protein VGI84_00485 [Pseudonocardiaceae bacterium]|jgi:hypothetical protein
MLKSDQVLWEQELAEHMDQYVDDPMIQVGLPYLQEQRKGLSTWFTALLLWTPVAVVGATIGWSVGWYVI